jgi:acetyl-CoA C-acetyltransferase
MRNCASSMQAIDSAMTNIQTGRSSLVLAGGTDALSRAPLLVSEEMTAWLASWYAAKTPRGRWAAIKRMRLSFLKPVIGLLRGLTDPVVGLSMGQTAEELAHRYGITRTEMDAYAARSHRRALEERAASALNTAENNTRPVLIPEIVPVVTPSGTLLAADDGARADSTPEKLAKLKPVFDQPYGNVTAGNSSQVTDGAAWLLLASKEAVQEHGLHPIGRIVDAQWAGLDPTVMGLGPVHAATPILQRHGLGLNDLDLWEINEAFAAQVLGCLRAWQDNTYCQTHFGSGDWGVLDEARLNVEGGAIALGHPVGASGARIVLHLLQMLRQRGLRRGMAAICIGGGQGGAMLVETLDGDTL